MTIKEYINWESLNMTWETIDMTWDEIFILIEVGNLIKGSGGYADYVKGNPWDKTRKEIGDDKTKKFIKLLCRVNNIDYEKISESKSDLNISVGEIEKVFNEGRKIGIKIDF